MSTTLHRRSSKRFVAFWTAICSAVIMAGCSTTPPERQIEESTIPNPEPTVTSVPDSDAEVDSLDSDSEDEAYDHGVMNGIIAIETDDITSIYATLSAIDPTTGSVLEYRTFVPPEDVRILVARDVVPSSYLARFEFNPDLTRVAAVKRLPADGSLHVGWVSLDGEFFDVSEAVSSSGSSFSGSTTHASPRFGLDGSFYYLDYDTKKVMMIPPDGLASADTEVGDPEVVMEVEFVDNQLVYVWPTGTISVETSGGGRHAEYEKSGPFAYIPGGFMDWLDDDTIICEHSNQILLYSPHPEGVDTDSAYTADECGVEGTDVALLPENDRESWNSVGSPDGRTIAFLSQSGSGNSPGELFIIDRKGGEPVEVATDHPFLRRDNSGGRLQLLDWR